MTYPNIPHLRIVESAGDPGSYPAYTQTDPDGSTAEHPPQRKQVTPCGGCQKATVKGDEITKYRRTWWHVECADKDIAAGNPGQAWLALGHDLGRSPRSYNVGETRAIVGALLGMVHEPDEYTEDDFSRPIGGLA